MNIFYEILPFGIVPYEVCLVARSVLQYFLLSYLRHDYDPAMVITFHSFLVPAVVVVPDPTNVVCNSSPYFLNHYLSYYHFQAAIIQHTVL